MRGRRVERRFGWDCHGLPAEVKAEQELGISGHPEIAAFGIDKFNDACRASVLQYTDQWRSYVGPSGALGRLRQRLQDARPFLHGERDVGLQDAARQGSTCTRDFACSRTAGDARPRCRTPRLGWTTSYKDRQDPALTVQFTLESGEHMVAWTTTPWTLPSNLALAVGPDIDYAVLDRDGAEIHHRRRPRRGSRGRVRRRRACRHTQGLRPRRTPVHAAVRLLHRHRAPRHRARLAGAGRGLRSPRTAPASCTWRPASAKTTKSPATQRASPRCVPMDEHGCYTAEIATTSGRTSSMRTRRSSRL